MNPEIDDSFPATDIRGRAAGAAVRDATRWATRPTLDGRRPPRQRRRSWAVAGAIGLVGVAGLVTALALRAPEPTGPAVGVGAVSEHFAPTVVPDGYIALAFDDTLAQPDGVSTNAMQSRVYERSDGQLIVLSWSSGGEPITATDADPAVTIHGAAGRLRSDQYDVGTVNHSLEWHEGGTSVVVAANGRTTAELTALAEATIVDASGARFDDPSLTLRYEGDATPLAAALSLVTVGFTGPTGMSAVALTPTTPASGDATVPTIVLSRLPERTGATYLLRGVLSGWTADEINGTSGWRRDVTVGGHRSVTLAWELDGALFVANGIDTADDQLSAVVASIGPVDDSTWATMLAATATRRAQTADSGGSSSNSGSVEVAPASTLVVVGEPSPSPVPTTPASSPAAPASTATP